MAFRIDGNRVSRDWWVVLRSAELDNVIFLLNDGQRTMAEQRARWEKYKRDGWPLAAFPSPTAPHIRKGHQAHALDLNAPLSIARIMRYLRKHGERMVLTVPGEPWHGEIVGGDAALHRLSRRLLPKLDRLYLTDYERKVCNILLTQRYIAKHHGGWKKVSPSHLKQAVKAKRWLKKRARWLAKSNLSKHRRRERLRYIRSVING